MILEVLQFFDQIIIRPRLLQVEVEVEYELLLGELVLLEHAPDHTGGLQLSHRIYNILYIIASSPRHGKDPPPTSTPTSG